MALHRVVDFPSVERHPVAPSDLAQADAAAIEALRRAVTAMIASDATHDLTQRQLGTLLLVCCMPGPHTIRGIAGQLDLLKPAVTRAVDVLEGERLVQRRPDPADRRSVLVVPTPAGRHFVAGIAVAMRGG
jgi:DNA-binding MarR family transcriptional regulator